MDLKIVGRDCGPYSVRGCDYVDILGHWLIV